MNVVIIRTRSENGVAMIESRSKFILHANVARTESDDKIFDDAKAGRPIKRFLNRIERVAAVHRAQIDLRFDKGMQFTFDSADNAVLGACEMQQRCAVLPQIPSLKLALRIGIHQGVIRQRAKDIVDNIPEIAAELTRVNDGILISRDIFNSLGEDLCRFVVPFKETVAGMSMNVFVIEWREILAGTHSGEPLPFSSKHSLRTGPRLLLQSGLKTLELSEHNPLVTIGRDPTSDLVLANIHASRNHCRIEYTAKGILLTDSSANGTTVVTGNKQEILVKNSGVALNGEGMIFFGRPFKGERRGCIRYESF
jgi:hypothetical protein